MILFTYLCSQICLLLNTPAPIGTTLRCRRNSRRFEAGVPKKMSRIELYMVDKGFGGRQYQKTTLASNPKRDYGVMILGYTTIICLVGIIHMATIPCIVRSGEHTNNNSMCAVDRRFPLTNRVFIIPSPTKLRRDIVTLPSVRPSVTSL